MKVNFKKFVGSLPYASQSTGVYQALLGWKSLKQTERIHGSLHRLMNRPGRSIFPDIEPKYTFRAGVMPEETEFTVSVGNLAPHSERVPGIADSIIGRRVERSAAAHPRDVERWVSATDPNMIERHLSEMHDEIMADWRSSHRSPESSEQSSRQSAEVLEAILRRESIVAGQLSYLHGRLSTGGGFDWLQPGASLRKGGFDSGFYEWLLPSIDPSVQKQLKVDPTNVANIEKATVSPIGLLHLYRQFFFEFDTFLGSPVQHVWLSPGGSVELVEVNTRKVLIERQIERSVESIDRTESSTTAQDELSDGVRHENAQNTKLGVSGTGTVNYGVTFINGSATISSSLDYEVSQTLAREQTHKTNRQQTQKVSNELKQSYRSVFKTVTETTDVNSRRYVLQNSGTDLLNYELRRKMRQVGVQVQDMGSRLCWQLYVDDAGRGLGLGLLVHVSATDDLTVHDPDKIPVPPDYVESGNVPYHFSGRESPWPPGLLVVLRKDLIPKDGYVFKNAKLKFVGSSGGWGCEAWPESPNTTKVMLEADSKVPLTYLVDKIPAPNGKTQVSVKQVLFGLHIANTDGGRVILPDDMDFELNWEIVYTASQQELERVQVANASAATRASEERIRVYRQALYQAARDRIKAMGQVQSRKFEDLREEERVIVYRQIIRNLLEVAGIKNSSNIMNHVFSDIVNSMFEMDSMLYFVAPEWWIPRPQPSWKGMMSNPQSLEVAEVPKDEFGDPIVDIQPSSWGGAAYHGDNYLLTEDSNPARLGASLGWTLQLDGDDMRNAFLNAPWVKAVVPMRPGMEHKALQWLASPHVEGHDGLDARYEFSSEEEKTRMVDELKNYAWTQPELKLLYSTITAEKITVYDAIRYLIIRLQQKTAAALQMSSAPSDATVNFLPPDKVYEYGFDPLDKGFKAVESDPYEVFDQWIEVVPTDQIVAVQVEYDPKTGQQI